MALANEHDQQKKIKTSYFSNEIILEILIRLHVKSLLLCKSVCKLWHSFMSDSHFIKYHLMSSTCNINFAHHRLIINDNLNRSINSCPLYDVVFEKYINELEPCFPVEVLTRGCDGRLKIIGSCNGLLCILKSRTLLIYNPSTRIWSELPKVPFGTMYGFGYDECTDDYKVVAITHEQSKVKICSLKTGTWKKIGDFPHGHLFSNVTYQSYESGKYSNGALHWAGVNQGFGPVNLWPIVSLDLATETYGEVLQPVYDKGDKYLGLGVLGKWLCVLCKYDVSRVDVWVMKVYGVKDSWTKLISIPYQNDIGSLDYVVPLYISNDTKVLLRFRSKLVVYNIHNSSSIQIPQKFNDFSEMCIVVESLVSPCFPLMHADILKSLYAS